MTENWYLYRHIRLDKNEPFYIGIGCKKDYGRAFETHKSKRNIFWIRIFNKTDIKTEILFDNCTKEFVVEKEKEFIFLYGRKDLNSGCLTNMTDGGDGVFNMVVNAETKEKIRQSMLGSKNYSFGTKQSKETIEKRIKSSKITIANRSEEYIEKLQHRQQNTNCNQKVAMYHLNTGKFFTYCKSYSEAERLYGGNNSKITLVCNFKRFQHNNFIYRKASEKYNKDFNALKELNELKNSKVRKKRITNKINMLSTDKVLIKTFDSIKEATLFIEANALTSIQRVISGERNHYKGYKWEKVA